VIKFFCLYLFFVVSVLSGTSNYFYTNPASLNLDSNYIYRINYLNANVKFTNNSLNLSQIYNNFIKDIEWDNTQKANLLNSIPASGFTAILDTVIKPVELLTRIFSASVQYRDIVAVQAPKDLFDLVLFGNDLNRQYNISDFQFDRLKYLDFAFGVCFPLIRPATESNILSSRLIQQFSIGGRLHWLKGNFITHTDSSSGSIATTPNAIIGNIKLFQTTAYGGNNFAVDFGAITKFNKSISFGVALLNFNTGFTWNKNTNYRIIDASIDSFSLGHYIETGSFDSLYAIKDTTFSIANVKSTIPAQFLIQASYQPIDFLTFATSYCYYLSDCLLVCDFRHSWNLELHLNLSKFFTTAFSFTTNLQKEYFIGNYFHFITRGLSLNLGVEQRNGYVKSAKGLGLNLYFSQNL
jgi:hypothetical protein